MFFSLILIKLLNPLEAFNSTSYPAAKYCYLFFFLNNVLNISCYSFNLKTSKNLKNTLYTT